jgi:hypothetical protein
MAYTTNINLETSFKTFEFHKDGPPQKDGEYLLIYDDGSMRLDTWRINGTFGSGFMKYQNPRWWGEIIIKRVDA